MTPKKAAFLPEFKLVTPEGYAVAKSPARLDVYRGHRGALDLRENADIVKQLSVDQTKLRHQYLRKYQMDVRTKLRDIYRRHFPQIGLSRVLFSRTCAAEDAGAPPGKVELLLKSSTQSKNAALSFSSKGGVVLIDPLDTNWSVSLEGKVLNGSTAGGGSYTLTTKPPIHAFRVVFETETDAQECLQKITLVQGLSSGLCPITGKAVLCDEVSGGPYEVFSWSAIWILPVVILPQVCPSSCME